jgi:hypothetical protein
MPAEKRPPDDAAGSPTGRFGGGALGALSGGSDALGGLTGAAATLVTCPLPLLSGCVDRTPAPPPGDAKIRSHADRRTVGE